MQQGNNEREEESVFEDETCNQCIEEITRLKALIEIQEKKLFKAMQNAKSHMGVPPIPPF